MGTAFWALLSVSESKWAPPPPPPFFGYISLARMAVLWTLSFSHSLMAHDSPLCVCGIVCTTTKWFGLCCWQHGVMMMMMGSQWEGERRRRRRRCHTPGADTLALQWGGSSKWCKQYVWLMIQYFVGKDLYSILHLLLLVVVVLLIFQPVDHQLFFSLLHHQTVKNKQILLLIFADLD